MAILEVDNISKRFGGLLALNDVSFGVEKGEILGIIGPNGAGKTTLFGVVSGFIAPSSGDVRFDGQRITGISPDRLTRCGLVRSFQIVQTFADMTTLEVVTTAALTRRPLRQAIDYAAEVLTRVGLGAKLDETPATLSLQDKKLLEVAKCVATDPQCILLDEVMAGLTMAETEAPMAIIRELNSSGVTIVMVEHVMPVIMRMATRMVVINFGEKIAEGTPDEIIKDRKVIDAYFGEHLDA
ncbi:ABC transporter ATP-binding protein [Rhodopseudomonas palustris]|uniref:ABC transporter ATP-binding protein n=1 Tax=Rhodopseudomonas palustris (strain ATCC BAA-98 / CGA009) TaxID=258594 RepID=Q6N9X0_RHOPA|nr:ABC transporter ATP-binding protein [Rhodopseudomonas palustris]OPF91343.1 ABC transporter ATP-binding protein [Rhodopseudomonas palustris]PPQ43824.1 ABC transporter ATP-binding protein [Rhodopseudomonas palustris]QQM02913.1 Lipopolysaccharide export system ATP-binding protein LptB [Rhodopseudomonas palustris]RJF60494.1 ABC transporter ATP-binding protein [Rhodopseudomonas palustris]WAB79087.1 ABC transporter ATP-binding protein [Rhodopseudomonas palustris]